MNKILKNILSKFLFIFAGLELIMIYIKWSDPGYWQVLPWWTNLIFSIYFIFLAVRIKRKI